MTDRTVVIVNLVCWGIVALVWLVGALHNARYGRSERIKGQPTSIPLVVVGFLGCVLVVVVGRAFAQNLTVEAWWVRALGAGVLVVSTIFTLWARFSLGALWSVGPRVGKDRHLMTDGPYAVTRHPIYTGMLGMLVGTALLGGLGLWIVPLAIGAIAFEVKIRMEEELLLVIFADQYSRYQERVPRLVPGLRALGRRHHRPR
jgi:protein-S-isoprenylcysteine O-methyltransferase Ste14